MGRPRKVRPEENKIPEQPATIPQELFDLAKKIGLSKEQIDSLGTFEALKAFCDKVSPSTNPDALPKADTVNLVFPDGNNDAIRQIANIRHVPSVIEVAKDDLTAEKATIERIVRKLNIKFNNPKLKTITKTVVFDCESKRIVSGQYDIV